MSEGMIEYSVVTPVYNAERSLEELAERLTTVLSGTGKPYEIIMVDDGSRDRSWEIMQGLAGRIPEMTAVRLIQNVGQGGATLCGIAHACGEYIVTVDDDLQFAPEDIPVLIDALAANPDVDVVMGTPERKRHAAWRRFGSCVVNRINASVFGLDDSLVLSSFRVMRRPIAQAICEIRNPRPAVGPLLCSVTTRIKNASVQHGTRATGRSGYTLSKLVGLSISRVVNYSTLPLRILGLIGMLGVAVSTVLGMLFFARYLIAGARVPGWTTVVLLLLGISGFNFFAFGVIGEYLLRVLQSSQGRPQYIVRDLVGSQCTVSGMEKQ